MNDAFLPIQAYHNVCSGVFRAEDSMVVFRQVQAGRHPILPRSPMTEQVVLDLPR